MIGYIKLHRKILQNPIVFKTSSHFTIWIYILLSATHKKYDTVFNNERFTLESGQFITGIIKLEETLKIHRSKIQRILKLFENENQIEQQTTNLGRLITIKNWYKYQINPIINEKQNKNQIENEWKLNNNINNNNTININNIDQNFEIFWKKYPKKIGKKQAFLKFKKIKIDFNLILKSLENHKRTEQWSNIKYIPHPTTWLNQERYNDEIEIPKVERTLIISKPEKSLSKKEEIEIEAEKEKLKEFLKTFGKK